MNKILVCYLFTGFDSIKSINKLNISWVIIYRLPSIFIYPNLVKQNLVIMVLSITPFSDTIALFLNYINFKMISEISHQNN